MEVFQRHRNQGVGCRGTRDHAESEFRMAALAGARRYRLSGLRPTPEAGLDGMVGDLASGDMAVAICSRLPSSRC
jgi:hypothetical protein